MKVLIMIATAAATCWYFIRKAQTEQQPKAIVNLGPFVFTVPTNKYIDAIIERIKTGTSITPTLDGILMTFPFVPIPAPFGLGMVEYPLPKKIFTWDQIGQKLTNYQSRDVILGLYNSIKNITVEGVSEIITKISIPQIKIPIY